MCEFLSWVELNIDGKTSYFYLTRKELNSSRGRKIRKTIGSDINGHGAIRKFYGIKQEIGTNIECTNFYSIYSFPEEIVKDIKAGNFRGFGIDSDLLINVAWEKFIELREVLEKKYDLTYSKFQKDLENIITTKGGREFIANLHIAWDKYEKEAQAAFWDLFAVQGNRPEDWRT